MSDDSNTLPMIQFIAVILLAVERLISRIQSSRCTEIKSDCCECCHLYLKRKLVKSEEENPNV